MGGRSECLSDCFFELEDCGGGGGCDLGCGVGGGRGVFDAELEGGGGDGGGRVGIKRVAGCNILVRTALFCPERNDFVSDRGCY